jgi:hypothetical protein
LAATCPPPAPAAACLAPSQPLPPAPHHTPSALLLHALPIAPCAQGAHA